MSNIENNSIIDEGDRGGWWIMIPNIIDQPDQYKLSVHAFRLYIHLKRVVGEKLDNSGLCWQSTRTLANYCNMSLASISKAKKELELTELIKIELVPGNNGFIHHITLVDIWEKNFSYFTKQKAEKRSPHERLSSSSERKRSPRETKNNPSSKTLEEFAPKIGAPSPTPERKNGKNGIYTFSQEEFESGGLLRPLEKNAPQKPKTDTSHRAAKKPWRYIYPDVSWIRHEYHDLYMTFLDCMGKMYFPNNSGEAGLVHKSVHEWTVMGADPDDVQAVIKEMRRQGLTIKDTNSITGMLKNAISIKEKPRTSKINVEELEIE